MSAGTLWALSGDAIWMDSRPFWALWILRSQRPMEPLLRRRRFWCCLPTSNKKARHASKGVSRSTGLTRYFSDHSTNRSSVMRSAHPSTSSRWQLSTSKDTNFANGPRTGLAHSLRPRNASSVRQKSQDLSATMNVGKAHGHAISREVLTQELRIRVETLESVEGFERAVRRAWALWYYVFEKMPVSKGILSQEYSFFRFGKEAVPS
jgi:hypothetical protein